MSRKQAREFVFKMVYSLPFSTGGQDPRPYNDAKFIYNINVGAGIMPAQEQDYIENLYNTVKDNLESIDGVIKQLATTIAFDKIYPVDLAVIRLGVAEILYSDTPRVVAITSAVEIAKKYSTEGSASFVNGVLSGMPERSVQN